jgi:hypothetical protein
MADWATISSLATAGGTLVLAVATFASVRSGNRSARIAEQALQEQRRPVLVHSHPSDAEQKIPFVDGHWARASGGGAAVEHVDGIVYLAMSLRNVGAGIGVCQGWYVRSGHERAASDHAPEQDFRMQTRDLYIPAGDIGLWQGALRDSSEPIHDQVARSIDQGEPVSIELLYTDQVGGQRTISRFNLLAVGDGNDPRWLTSVVRHWYLDGAGPR